MADILAQLAFVVAGISLLATLSLAREVANLRGQARIPTDGPSARVAAFELLGAEGPVRLTPDADAILVGILPNCSGCEKLLSQSADAILSRPGPYALLVHGSRTVAEEITSSFGLDPSRVLADPHGRLLRAAGVASFPSAVLIERGEVTETIEVTAWSDLARLSARVGPSPLRLASRADLPMFKGRKEVMPNEATR